MALVEECSCVFRSDRVRILPVSPVQKVDIGIANLPDLSPAAKAFRQFLLGRFTAGDVRSSD
ncbi:MAG: hypothetical protein ACOX74_05360 [Lachnospiraceae bacterium]